MSEDAVAECLAGRISPEVALARLLLGGAGADAIAGLLAEQHVTHAFVTPAVLATVPSDDLPDLRVLCVAGENCAPESVRRWVREAEVVSGQRLGLASTSEMAELRRRNAELEATVEVLKAATSFFARACDPLPSWSSGSSTSFETGSESHRSAER